MSGSLETLKRFIAALEREGVIPNFNVEEFNHRLRLQKCVYFAKALGLEFPYEFNLYIHGPYCPDLAKDYYQIQQSTSEPMEIPEELVQLVKGKDERWLELASTHLMISKRYPYLDVSKIYQLIKNVKPYAKDEELRRITEQLREKGLI